MTAKINMREGTARHRVWVSFASLKERIRQIKSRPSKDTSPADKEAQIQQAVVAFLGKNGTFLTDGNEAIYVNDKGVGFSPDFPSIPLDAGSADFGLLMRKMGVYRNHSLYKNLADYLSGYVIDHGVPMARPTFATYVQSDHRMHIDNGHAGNIVIDADAIRLRGKGYDGVLFKHRPQHQPFQIVARPEQDLFDQLVLASVNYSQDNILDTEELKFLLRIWFLAVIFRDLMPTRPILTVTGPKGSGKTTLLRLFGLLLYGPEFEVTPMPSLQLDFDVTITNEGYLAIDNLDTSKSWVLDKLAVIATGGSIARKTLYTNNGITKNKIDCFLAITSRTPHFRRDDIADRAIIVRVSRFHQFLSDRYLRQRVLMHRDAIMSQMMHECQAIIREYAQCLDSESPVAIRLADFGTFAQKVGAACGRSDLTNAILSKLAAAQNDFRTGLSDTTQLMRIWLSENAGHQFLAREICDELATIADEEGIPFPYEGKSRALARHIPEIANELSGEYSLQVTNGRARSRRYTFTPIISPVNQ